MMIFLDLNLIFRMTSSSLVVPIDESDDRHCCRPGNLICASGDARHCIDVGRMVMIAETDVAGLTLSTPKALDREAL